MLFMLALAQAALLLCAFSKAIKRRPALFYWASVAIVALLMVYDHFSLAAEWPEWTYDYLIAPWHRGALPAALFTAVMYAGALSAKHPIVRRLMGIRAELSIIACILTLGHNLVFGLVYIPALFLKPHTLNASRLAASCITIALLLLMIPLMVTSFPGVRRRMRQTRWKRLQRWAYPFYGLIYVHAMVLFVPLIHLGGAYVSGVIAYTTVFGMYAVLRIWKHRQSKRRRAQAALAWSA